MDFAKAGRRASLIYLSQKQLGEKKDKPDNTPQRCHGRQPNDTSRFQVFWYFKFLVTKKKAAEKYGHHQW